MGHLHTVCVGQLCSHVKCCNCAYMHTYVYMCVCMHMYTMYKCIFYEARQNTITVHLVKFVDFIFLFLYFKYNLLQNNFLGGWGEMNLTDRSVYYFRLVHVMIRSMIVVNNIFGIYYQMCSSDVKKFTLAEFIICNILL